LSAQWYIDWLLITFWLCQPCVPRPYYAALHCTAQLPGTQRCSTETLRLLLELWNFVYILVMMWPLLPESCRHFWLEIRNLSIPLSFTTVHWNITDHILPLQLQTFNFLPGLDQIASRMCVSLFNYNHSVHISYTCLCLMWSYFIIRQPEHSN